MELRNRFDPIRFCERLSERIRALPRSSRTGALAHSLRRHSRRLLGVLLLFLSGVLGIWAQDLASAQALNGWLRSHPPSLKVWQSALTASGFHAVLEQKLLGRASHSLPSLVDAEGTAWATQDLNWVALYSRQDDGSSHSLFCYDCTQNPAPWVPVGIGWAAFDPLMAAIQAAAATRKPVTPVRTAVRARDPREIVY